MPDRAKMGRLPRSAFVLWHPTAHAKILVPPIMPENDQENGVVLDFKKQMVRKFLETCPAKSASIEMIAAGISLNRNQNQIELRPK